MDAKDKMLGLNEIREAAFHLYPNATKITITIDGEKIRVAPIEDYEIPVGLETGEFDEE